MTMSESKPANSDRKSIPFPDWLDENQKIISILGVLFALTVFVIQFVPKPWNLFAAGFCGFAMILVLSALIQRGVPSDDIRTFTFVNLFILATVGLITAIGVMFRAMLIAYTFLFALVISVIGGVTLVQYLHKTVGCLTRGLGKKGAATLWSATAIASLTALAIAITITVLVTNKIGSFADWLGAEMSIPDLTEPPTKSH